MSRTIWRRFAAIALICGTQLALSSFDATAEEDCCDAEFVSLESMGGDASSKDAKDDFGKMDKCCGPCDCCAPLWTVRAGAIFLKREEPTARTLFTNFSGATELMNAEGFDFETQTGFDFYAKRRLGQCSGVEVRYFGVDSWSADQSASNPTSFANGGFLLQPAPGGLANLLFGVPIVGTTIDATALSRLHSTEINLTRDVTDRLTVLAGFRWVELHEEFRADANYSVPFFGPQQWNIDSSVDNHMYGFQLGAAATLLDWRRFSLEGNLKAGVYYNRADVDASITRPASFLDLAASQKTDHTAFLGELGLVGAVQLTDCLSVRAGYQITWIEGVAVATDQFTTLIPSGGDEINVGGSPMYHGALVSLEVVW